MQHKNPFCYFVATKVGFALLLTFGLLGCATQPGKNAFQQQFAAQMARSAQTDDTVQATAYTFNIGDELDIKINEREDLNAQVKVRPDGMITLPIVGDLSALGKTASVLEQEIRQSYQNLGGSQDFAGYNDSKSYLISVNDELQIKFPYHEHLDQTVKVRPDGYISLSLVNDIVAEQKTPEGLEQELNRRYRKFLKNPNLTVVLKQFSSLRYSQNGKTVLAGLEYLTPTVSVKSFEPLEIFVAGNVEKPGILGYRPTLTALAAIIEAGGHKLGAEMASVVVLRKSGQQPISMLIDLDNDDDPGLQAANDIPLKPYDVVFVPKSKINQAGDFVDELGRILPPLKQSSFSFIYDVLSNVSSQNAVSSQR